MANGRGNPGINELLVGGTGTGKTYALRTLVEAGLEVFVLATEPGIASSLGDLPADKMHWHYSAPANPGLEALLQSATTINRMSFKALTGLNDINKAKYGQFLDVLNSLVNFRCDRTGQEYGSVESWDTDRVIVIDSLSGLSVMAMDLVVGAKPVKAPGDWGVAQDNLERLVMQLCTGVRAHFVMTAHLERLKDETTGGIKLMASTLGQKLGPRIPRFFDDVIQTERVNEEWIWATSTLNTDTKARNLPWGSKLPPSFVPVIETWKKKGGVIPSVTSSPESEQNSAAPVSA